MSNSILSSEDRAKIMQKILQSKDFRERLAADAKAAIGEKLGIAVPESVTIHVLAPDTQTLDIIVPARPAELAGEFSVEELVNSQLTSLPDLSDAQKTLARGQLTLVAKAWIDEAFNQALIAHPAETVQQELGVEIPEKVAVKVLVEDAGNLYLPLPPELEEGELSNEQLEAVAGGDWILFGLVMGIAATGGALIGLIDAIIEGKTGP